MIEKYSFKGSENTGFYTVATNSYVLLGPEYQKKDFFEVDSVETKINRTNLVGLFAAGNSNCLLIPEEVSSIEKQNLDESGINYRIIDPNYNALGNLILCNDKGAVISEKISGYQEQIEEALEVPVKTADINDLNPGVSGIANSHGAVIHREASEKDARTVREALGLEDIDIGTVNMGSPFTGSGAAANDRHLLTGENTTGPEIGRFDRTMF